MTEQLFKDVDDYISRLLAQEDEVLKTILKNNTKAGLAPIHISALQGKLLQVFARACSAKRILEIGTHGGYSTAWLARALPENGKVVTIELEPHYAELAKRNLSIAGITEKTDILQGKALDILPQLKGTQPFDLVFIDADKPPYVEYFEWAVQLSRPGSFIIADNVIREGKVLDSNSSDEKVKGVQRLNKMLQHYDKVTATILPTLGAKEYDGMVVAVVN